MKYPTIEEVEKADHLQLCEWYRFLKSPGVHAITRPDFKEVVAREKKVMTRIIERFQKLGGFTPEISKQLGDKE